MRAWNLDILLRSLSWIAGSIGREDMRHMGRRDMVQCVVYDGTLLKTGVFSIYDIYLSYSMMYGLPTILKVTNGHLLLVIFVCT